MTDTRPDSAAIEGGHTSRTPGPDTDSGQADSQPKRKVSGDWLRFVPPVSALGTAFVLQVIAMTDTVGGALAGQYGRWAYLPAALLGVSVACCAEGGAAYLLDLYDKHLLAGDSVWILRLTMFAYVAASAGVIHWWTAHRHLPEIISWVLAGMSGSALYLWSRGSRWRRRDVMRRKGLIDEAMPKFSMVAKLFHPIRWFNTVRLISWEPVRTTGEARVRYDAWKSAKRARRSRTGDVSATARPDTAPPRPPVRAEVSAPRRVSADIDATADTGNVRELSAGPRRRAVSGQATIEELAATLRARHGDRTVGRPAAADTLREVHGSCSVDRVIAAKNVHNATVTGAREPADPEREVVVATG